MSEGKIGSYEGYEDFLVEKHDNGVVVGTMNRPERLNALGGGLRPSIVRFIREVRDDPEARVLVLTGAGRGFCSGADLSPDGSGEQWPAGLQDPRFAWTAELIGLRKPTIAAVNGAAAGGGFGITLLCDMRIASDRARFIPIWLKRAILPDDLVHWTLSRLGGYSRALKYIYLAEDIPLDEAERVGLVEKVVPHEEFWDYTMEFAGRLAKLPPIHAGVMKQTVLKSLFLDPWGTAMLDQASGSFVAGLKDGEEGRAAFRERREPVFRGE